MKQCAAALVPLTKGEPVDRSAAGGAWSAARSAAGAAYTTMSDKLIALIVEAGALSQKQDSDGNGGQ